MGEMHEPGDAESSRYSKGLRDAVQPDLSVVLEILTGIEDVEAADPEHHGDGKDDDAGIEAATDGDPSG